MRTLCGSGVPLATRRSERAVPDGWLAYSSRSRAGRMPRVATLTASISSEPVKVAKTDEFRVSIEKRIATVTTGDGTRRIYLHAKEVSS